MQHHASPVCARLRWDHLPIGLASLPFCAAIVCECVGMGVLRCRRWGASSRGDRRPRSYDTRDAGCPGEHLSLPPDGSSWERRPSRSSGTHACTTSITAKTCIHTSSQATMSTEHQITEVRWEPPPPPQAYASPDHPSLPATSTPPGSALTSHSRDPRMLHATDELPSTPSCKPLLHWLILHHTIHSILSSLSPRPLPPQLLGFLLHPNPQLLNLAVVNLLPYTVQGSPYRKLFFEAKSVGNERGYLKVLAGISRASKEEVRCPRTCLRPARDVAKLALLAAVPGENGSRTSPVDCRLIQRLLRYLHHVLPSAIFHLSSLPPKPP